MSAETLELIAQTLAERYGQAYAERWRAERKEHKTANLPKVHRASELLSHDEAPKVTARNASGASPTVTLRSHSRPLEPSSEGRRPWTSTPKPQPQPQLTTAPTSAAQLTARLTAGVAKLLPPSVYHTYRILHQVALEHAAIRGYSPSVTHVSFGCPSEIVAFYLGINRSTLWRHRQVLHEHGLLDSRIHWTGSPGHRLSDGVIWQVKLYPGRGKRARLSYHDLKCEYRDLVADIACGRTAFQEMTGGNPRIRAKRESSRMQQSLLNKNGELESIKKILSWTLPPAFSQTPLDMTVASPRFIALETVLDVEHAPHKGPERRELVNAGAQAIAYTLGDQDSLDFYRKLLWNLLRARDYLGLYQFQALYYAVVRVRADSREGFARSPGALLVSRLKRWESWEAVQRCAHYRVGAAPLRGFYRLRAGNNAKPQKPFGTHTSTVLGNPVRF